MPAQTTNDRCLAIITGATGITGRHCLERILHSRPDWHALTLSRRPLDPGYLASPGAQKRVHQAHANLLMMQEVQSALKETVSAEVVDSAAPVRVYHCAYLESGEGPVRDCELNLAMLKNVVEAVESLGWPLAHVYTMEGSKWYGQQYLEPLNTPYNENDPRHIGPNFYYDLEDYLCGRVSKKSSGCASWTWSALRPGPVIGYSTGSYMSLLPSIAVYGSICKHLGLEMKFPGTKTAYMAPMEVCDARVLADAMLFISTDPGAGNEAYNINNGDYFRWEQVWPAIAAFFGVQAGPPLRVGDLTQVMEEYRGVWEEIVKKHGLKDVPYDKLATWKFLDFVCRMPEGGWFGNTVKLRRAGFQGMVAAFTLDFSGKIKPAWQNFRKCMASEPGSEPKDPYLVITDPERYLDPLKMGRRKSSTQK